MKSHHLESVATGQFLRVGHLHISEVDSFLALLKHRIGPTDPLSSTHVSSCLTELRWSRRGLVIVYTEADEVYNTTDMLFDCTDSTTWFQILDVLAMVSHLANSLE